MKKSFPPPVPRRPIPLIAPLSRLRAALDIQDPQSAEGTIRVRRSDLRIVLDHFDPEE